MQEYIDKIRDDFPILQTKVHNKPLVYLDNAATTQRPQAVIDAVNNFYTKYNSNVHRGVHYLSQAATKLYEDSREKVKNFINANASSECIFVNGTTDGINLVASSFGEKYVTQGDEVLITYMEHHSNIVPWQLLCERKGAVLKAIPITESGELELDKIDELLTDKVKILSLVHISNSLGTVNPVKDIIKKAQAKNIPVLIDGAQGAAHIKVDVQDLDCDFYVFSGHKMYGPTGVGVLYGKQKWLDAMPPYQGGGDMILTVSIDKGSTYNKPPYKFEAGTPNIAQVIGLGAAIDYLNGLDFDIISRHKAELLSYATEKLAAIPGVKIIGTASNKASVVAFISDKVHAHDMGTIVDSYGLAIRAGHHCTMPVMEYYGVAATCRASFTMYNTFAEIDSLCDAVQNAVKMFTKKN